MRSTIDWNFNGSYIEHIIPTLEGEEYIYSVRIDAWQGQECITWQFYRDVFQVEGVNGTCCSIREVFEEACQFLEHFAYSEDSKPLYSVNSEVFDTWQDNRL